MTDRELLELAAKAIGMKLNGSHFMLAEEGVWNHWQSEYWNPLTDDGDRYRLIRTLKMRIDFQEGRVFCGREAAYRFPVGDEDMEAYAIVRAAAEIGKEMK